ncbi:hypothetical protein F5Y15DRAFT_69001 [Xylariaceae sp. FL0016]|nr:hypothetical protein F5Y15DRAFT_69001 [Xylariaceae sp. FL0016]
MALSRPPIGLLLALLSMLAGLASSQNTFAKFTFPVDDGLTFNYLDTIEVGYESDFTLPVLYTFCYPANSDDIFTPRTDFPGSNNNTAPTLLNFTTGVDCWFNLRPDKVDDNHVGVNGPKWRFVSTQNEIATIGPDSLSTSSSSSSTVTSTSSSASNTATASASSSSSPSSSSSGGLSTGAIAGIGVGVGLGVIALGLLAWFLIRRRSHKTGYQQGTTPTDQHPPNAYHSIATRDSPSGHGGMVDRSKQTQARAEIDSIAESTPYGHSLAPTEEQRFRGSTPTTSPAAGRAEMEAPTVYELPDSRNT